MGNAINTESWLGQSQLHYVEACLWWNGMISRREIIEKYSCSSQHASAILQSYLGLNPQAMSYNLNVKRYLANPKMQCVFETPSFPQELEKDEDCIRRIEPPLRKAAPMVLRYLMVAVRQNLKVKIHYQSRSSDQPNWREIAPHAFGYDGMRYHTRAWCYQNEAFRDFSLLRISDIKWPTETSGIESCLDEDWFEEIEIKLKINQSASDALKKALIEDYELENEQSEISIKSCKAMKPYVLYRMGLDIEANFPGGSFFTLNE